MRAPGLFDPGVVPRIHAGPFRKLTRNGKVIGIARHFSAKSLAVPLGVDSRVNPRALRPGAAMTANGNCCTCVPGLLPQLPAPPLNPLFDKGHWTKPLRGNTLI
jgi:hypothetical protein